METFSKYPGLFAGFHAEQPDPAVPELTHAGEEWAPDDYKILQHKHPVWEFYLQLEGETIWRSRGRFYEVQSGTLLAVPPQIPHSLTDRVKTAHHYLFAGLDIAAIVARLPELSGAFPEGKILLQPETGSLAQIFRQLIGEVAVSRDYRTSGLRTAVKSLTVELARVLTGRPVQSLITMHPGIQRARDLLDQQPTQNWSAATLAQKSGLSISRLNERFRAELSTSPRQYLLDKRLELAAQSLLQNDLPITDLAFEMGFSSSQHFALAFRKKYGISARAYRQKHWSRKS